MTQRPTAASPGPRPGAAQRLIPAVGGKDNAYYLTIIQRCGGEEGVRGRSGRRLCKRQPQPIRKRRRTDFGSLLCAAAAREQSSREDVIKDVKLGRGGNNKCAVGLSRRELTKLSENGQSANFHIYFH